MKAAAARPPAAGIIGDLRDLLFPPCCPACRGRGEPGGGPALCAACARDLALPEDPRCAGCGRAQPLPGAAFCPACAGGFARDAVVCGAAYTGAARALVRGLKYRADFAAGRLLARLLAARLGEAAGAEVVVPVPLHPRRLRERGFNQAALIAREVARAAGLPFLPDALARTRPTAPLAGLDPGARAAEVRAAFAVRRPAEVAGRRVLLVDDVLTTGATAEGCCRALKEAGAAWTAAAVAARVLPPLSR